MLLGDRPLDQLSRREVAQQIAVVPQETELAFEYTAIEIVLMGRHPHLGLFTVEGPDDIRIAQEALAATGTAHLADRPFHQLSGGEKQRVVIAAALAQSARLLLLDEPTASLDLGYQLEVSSLLKRLNRDHGVTMAISTHDLNLAASICRELILMRDGRVIATGPTNEVLTPENVQAALRRRSRRSRARRDRPHDGGAGAADRPHEHPPPHRHGGAGVSRVHAGGAGVRAHGRQHADLARQRRSIARSPGTPNVDAQIFFVARLPRVLSGALVGAALAAAGVVLQAMLRNPLATPFTLGVSAGAALGAMIAIALGLDLGALGVSSVPIASFAGSLVAIGIVYALATSQTTRPVDQRAAARGRDPELVLLGVDPVRAVHVGLHRSPSARCGG